LTYILDKVVSIKLPIERRAASSVNAQVAAGIERREKIFRLAGW
jgi:hypothetical protein